jgi:S1-C subfamily serine protease
LPLLALAAVLFSATLPASPREATAPPVVLVTDGERYGAGVVWSAPEGLVLTALHVVELMPEIRISLDGEEQPARVVDRDPALDLALLRASGPLRGTGAAEQAAAAPAKGDRVRLLGFPGGSAVSLAGTVVDGARRFAGSRYVEIGCQAAPGASGGPVLDERGAVVGLVDIVLTDRGTTLAIPIDAALARFASGHGPGRQSTVLLMRQFTAGSRRAMPETGFADAGSRPSARDVAASQLPVAGSPAVDWNEASALRVLASQVPVGSTP